MECGLNMPVYSEFSIVECVAGYHAGEFSVVEYICWGNMLISSGEFSITECVGMHMLVFSEFTIRESVQACCCYLVNSP